MITEMPGFVQEHQWQFDEPHFVDSEDCMGCRQTYWRAWGKRGDDSVCGVGKTKEQAAQDVRQKAAEFKPKPISSMTIADLIRESHATAVEKGWWEKDRPFSEGIALMHSELSEVLEEWRKYGMNQKMLIYTEADVLGGKPEGIAVEFADLLIRIGDWCGKHAIPLEEAPRAKMAYNKTRLHRHGGKLA